MGLGNKYRIVQDREGGEGGEVVISEKVFFGLIAAIVFAIIGVLLNSLLGTYGIIIGAFFTWVMASYLYAIYGVDMLNGIRLRVLLFLPTSVYIALVLYLFAENDLVGALAQVIGSIASSTIFYLLLHIVVEYYKAKGAV